MRKKRIFPWPFETRSILWEGASVIKLVKELQEFLKPKMKQVNDSTFGSYWVCTTCDRSKEYGSFGKTAEFCQKRGLDWNTFTEILNNFSGFAYNITSDADVLNKLQVRGEENTAKEDVPSD
jgi:midasin (ATPase involved in ribosome maturation)